ncbi:hypothetical protein [Tolypothrix sp. VBCCA 56010]|uniref:hypothetical protein n=1 Tax=Tolypothrix sp. VBCCA 56010 TaxID=3137731 RepID=UPI003D7CC2F2
MLKNLTFGILAAALAIAPGVAFAGQDQTNVQVTQQDGFAQDGSTNAQSSTSTNVQQQIQNAQKKAGGYRGRYNNPACRGGSSAQAQDSTQITRQSGTASGGSVNAQDSSTASNQRQLLARRGC